MRAFANGDRTIRVTLHQHRHQNVPMETRGGVFSYDPDTEELLVWIACQGVHTVRDTLAERTRIPDRQDPRAHRRCRWLVRTQDRCLPRGRRVRRGIEASRAPSEVDRRPVRTHGRVGPCPRRILRRRSLDHRRRRDPRAEGRHDDGLRRLPGPGSPAAGSHRIAVARPVQGRSVALLVQIGNHQQGELHRLPRTMGSRDLRARARHRPHRPRARRGAARHPTAQRRHAGSATTHDGDGPTARGRHRQGVARATRRDHRSTHLPQAATRSARRRRLPRIGDGVVHRGRARPEGR